MTEAIKEKGALSVHTEKLFPIIKKWLYSERDIFLRELISNAYDAVYKLERLGDMGEYKETVPDGKVDIAIDSTKKTLTISDNGLGMTGEEVKKYINQIAFSGAEEFLEKYEKDGSNQSIIGHFGLGFFSAFMVAEEIEITTRSHRFPKDAAGAVHWKCTGTTDFTLDSATRESVGTDIILHLSEDNQDLLDEERIKALIVKFSDFLPIEIALNGKKINRQNPIWQRKPTELSEQDYKDFYQYLFPHSEEALFYVHLSIDFPFQVKGILYFPKIRADIDVTKTGRIKLFCNNVFVSDNIVDVIPQYLNMLQGVIDSHDIPLNVSRSALQNDARVKKLASHIVKKLADKLVALAKNDQEQYEGYWSDIHPFVKFGVLNDADFYDRVKPALLFTTLGNGTLPTESTESTEPTESKASNEEPSKKATTEASAEAIKEKTKKPENPESPESSGKIERAKEAKNEEKSSIDKEAGGSSSDKKNDGGLAEETAKNAKNAKNTASSAAMASHSGIRPHSMVTVDDYKARNPKLKDKILYATHEENEHRYIADVHQSGGEVLLLNSPIDPHFIQYLETKLAPVRFLRVDSAPVDELMAADYGEGSAKDQSLDEAGEKTYVEFFKQALNLSSQEVSFRTLADKQTAALFVVNEHMRRFQEMSSLMNTELLKNPDNLMGMTLVLNRAHPVIMKTRSWVRAHHSDQSNKSNKPDQSEQSSQSGQSEKLDKSEKSEKSDTLAQSGKSGKSEQSKQSGQSAQSSKAEGSSGAGKSTGPSSGAGKSPESSSRRSLKADANMQAVLQNVYDMALLRIGKLKGKNLEAFMERASVALEKQVTL